MRKLLIQLLAIISLSLIIIGLYRQNSSLRAQISILNQTPNRANAPNSGFTVAAQNGVPES